ncbi:MAG: aspartate aminotransferase family protein [Gemmatimonadaceae bacterium]|nr:aspartate aminotransferase family protein [Gemmatimonadaceae bacterium]
MSKADNALFLKDPAGDYPTIVRGEGIYLHDDEGRRWIDGAAGASNVTLGHGRSDIARVLGDQAETLAYAFSIHFESQPAREYAARLTALAPGDLNKAYFVSGGSEAIESAMKIARQYHLLRGRESKQLLISRWGGYHGGTLGAMSLSGVPGPRAPFASWLADFPHIAPCHPYRCRFEGCNGVCNLACADDLEVEIRRRGPENVAAFVCEPVPIAAFVCGVPPEGYFSRVREICDRHDVLFIADEIVTGFGRGGRLFAMEHWDVLPDMIVFGKGASSGYMPLGGVLMRQAIADAFADAGQEFHHIFTYVNNPLAMRVGLEVLDIIEREEILAHVCEMAAHLEHRSRCFLDRPSVGEVRTFGLILGIELVQDRERRQPFPAEAGFGRRVARHMRERGLNGATTSGCADGVNGDDLRFYPPLTITRPELDTLLDIVEESLAAAEKEVL